MINLSMGDIEKVRHHNHRFFLEKYFRTVHMFQPQKPILGTRTIYTSIKKKVRNCLPFLSLEAISKVSSLEVMKIHTHKHVIGISLKT